MPEASAVTSWPKLLMVNWRNPPCAARASASGYADRSETSAPSDSSLGLKFGTLTRKAVAAVNGPRVATTAPVPDALPTSRSPRTTAALGFVLDRFRYEAG